MLQIKGLEWYRTASPDAGILEDFRRLAEVKDKRKMRINVQVTVTECTLFGRAPRVTN